VHAFVPDSSRAIAGDTRIGAVSVARSSCILGCDWLTGVAEFHFGAPQKSMKSWK
jgi:hypothetical protein